MPAPCMLPPCCCGGMPQRQEDKIRHERCCLMCSSKDAAITCCYFHARVFTRVSMAAARHAIFSHADAMRHAKDDAYFAMRCRHYHSPFVYYAPRRQPLSRHALLRRQKIYDSYAARRAGRLCYAALSRAAMPPRRTRAAYAAPRGRCARCRAVAHDRGR